MSSDPAPVDETPPAKAQRTRERFIIYMVISFFATQGYAAFGTRVLGLDARIAYAITLVLVSIQNFFILMYYVYKSSHEHQFRQFVKFVQSVIGFRIWEFVLFLILHPVLGLHDQVAILIVQVQSIFLKSAVYKKHVFRTSSDPADAASNETPASTEDSTLTDVSS